MLLGFTERFIYELYIRYNKLYRKLTNREVGRMFMCKTKKWGNSIGLLIPRQEAVRLNLQENRDVVVDIIEKDNPFKELFGSGKQKKITRQEFLKTRKFLEPKRL